MLKKIILLSVATLVVLTSCKENNSNDPENPNGKKSEYVDVRFHFATTPDMMKYSTEKVYLTANGEEEKELTLPEAVALTQENDEIMWVNLAEKYRSFVYFHEVTVKVKRGEQKIRYEYTIVNDSTMPKKINIAFGESYLVNESDGVQAKSNVRVGYNFKSEKLEENLSRNSMTFSIDIK